MIGITANLRTQSLKAAITILATFVISVPVQGQPKDEYIIDKEGAAAAGAGIAGKNEYLIREGDPKTPSNSTAIPVPGEYGSLYVIEKNQPVASSNDVTARAVIPPKNQRLGWASKHIANILSDPTSSYANVEKTKQGFLYYRKSLREICSMGKDRCLTELMHRTVGIKSPDGYGTGFILFSDQKHMIVITAAHVINKAGHDLAPQRVRVEDGKTYRTLRSCALNSELSDVGIIKMLNYRSTIFPIPEFAFPEKGSTVLLADHRAGYPRGWTSTIGGYVHSRAEAYLPESFWPGSSGSAISNLNGSLVAILFGLLPGLDLTIATSSVDFTIEGPDPDAWGLASSDPEYQGLIGCTP